MKTRLGLTRDNALVSSIQEVSANIQGLKQPQRIGPNSLVTQTTEAPHVSGQAYALSLPQSVQHSFAVTFSADNQSCPLASLMLRFYTDAACSNEVHPSYASGANWPFPTIRKRPPLDAEATAAVWDVTGVGGQYGATGNYYVRAFVQSVDSGSVQVVETS